MTGKSIKRSAAVSEEPAVMAGLLCGIFKLGVFFLYHPSQ